MSPHAVRLMLTACVVAAITALSPGSALATVAPTLTLTQPGGSTAGSTTSLGLDITFNPSAGDAVSDLSIDLPPGLLVDASTDGGACLSVTGPEVPCEIAAGTATVAGAVTPAALYLERAPGTDDLAGVQLVAGSVSSLGSLSLNSSLAIGISPSLDTSTALSFSGLGGSGLSGLELTMTGVRLPSSCADDPAENVAVFATPVTSLTPVLARAGLPVTGCASLPYTPEILSLVTLSPHSTRATVVTTILQPAGQSATNKLKLSLPPGVLATKRLAPCVQGSPCVIGTASMTSPLLPPGSLSDGTMTLGGTPTAPTLTITFLEPTPLVLSGTLVAANGQLTLSNLPDIPVTDFTLRFTGTAAVGPVLAAHIANCQLASFHATLFPTSGVQAAGVNATAIYKGCPPHRHRGINRPTASASLSGVAAGHPRLSVRVTRGAQAPPIRQVWIRLPAGLHFTRSALRTGSSPGPGIARERIIHGRLLAVFRHSVASGTVRLGGPLLAESAALRRRVRAGSALPLKFVVGVLDTIGDRPTVGLVLKPR
jgi:hypothetical protein